MKSAFTTFAKLAFTLSILLLLSACGSELTGIDAPEGVENGTPFEVSVTHQFLDPDELISPTESPDGALVFGVFFPVGWSAAPDATYEGTWGGAPVSLPLELQSGIPDTNLVEWIESPDSGSAPQEIIDLVTQSDCSTVIEELDPPEVFQFAFFQTSVPIYELAELQTGDGGEFTFSLTPAGSENESEIVVIHGLLIGGPSNPDGASVTGGDPVQGDILGCSWYPDPDASDDLELWIPDSVFASTIQFGSESMPVPVMGGAMVAVLSLLLGMMGVLIGRRRSKQTS